MVRGVNELKIPLSVCLIVYANTICVVENIYKSEQSFVSIYYFEVLKVSLAIDNL